MLVVLGLMFKWLMCVSTAILLRTNMIMLFTRSTSSLPYGILVVICICLIRSVWQNSVNSSEVKGISCTTAIRCKFLKCYCKIWSFYRTSTMRVDFIAKILQYLCIFFLTQDSQRDVICNVFSEVHSLRIDLSNSSALP